jgi:hypothetical protein
MAVTSLLELLVLTEAQSQKATAVNTALAALEAALADTYALSTSAADVPGEDVVIPFNDTNDLSARTALRFIYLTLTAGATAAFDVIHPDNKHLFFVTNNTAHTATVKTAAGTGIAVTAGSTKLLYCNGVNVIEIPISGSGGSITSITQAEDYEVAFYGSPVDGEVMAEFIVGRQVTFPANLVGSVGSVGVNPTATVNLDVDDDGTKIGNIAISTSGVFTFTTTGGTARVVAAGSKLVVHNQASADATLENVLVTLLGTITVAQ